MFVSVCVFIFSPSFPYQKLFCGENKKRSSQTWDERFCIRGATQLRLTSGLNKNFPDEAPGKKPASLIRVRANSYLLKANC
jgi:hypothetical protein